MILYLSEKVKNRIFSSMSFWDKYGSLIIAIGIISLVIGMLVVFGIIIFRKERQEERMVDINGQKVDSGKIVTVCLMDSTFQFVQLVKGDVYIAPLCEKDGYDFAGWYYDTAFTKPYYNRPIKSNITLYPKWVKHS